jgi:hypothetical protein
LEGGSATLQWLNHIGPTLGDSVTEVTQTGPSELSFKRSAPAGLTAIELIALAEWLEGPNFPSFDLSLPPEEFTPGHHHRRGQKPQGTNQPPQRLKTK